MGLDILSIILLAMFSIGNAFGSPICSDDDQRVKRGSMSYDAMVEKWGRDTGCK